MRRQMKGQNVLPQADRKLGRGLIPVWLVVITLLAVACGRSTAPTSELAAPQITATPSTPHSASEFTQRPAEVPPSQDLQFSHLTTEDGLSEGRVWDITQDSRGFMWFTTLDGLNRYDGYEFKVYRQERKNPNSPGGSAFFAV